MNTLLQLWQWLDGKKTKIAVIILGLVAFNHATHLVSDQAEQTILLIASALGLYGVRDAIRKTAQPPSDPESHEPPAADAAPWMLLPAAVALWLVGSPAQAQTPGVREYDQHGCVIQYLCRISDAQGRTLLDTGKPLQRQTCFLGAGAQVAALQAQVAALQGQVSALLARPPQPTQPPMAMSDPAITSLLAQINGTNQQILALLLAQRTQPAAPVPAAPPPAAPGAPASQVGPPIQYHFYLAPPQQTPVAPLPPQQQPIAPLPPQQQAVPPLPPQQIPVYPLPPQQQPLAPAPYQQQPLPPGSQPQQQSPAPRIPQFLPPATAPGPVTPGQPQQRIMPPAQASFQRFIGTRYRSAVSRPVP